MTTLPAYRIYLADGTSYVTSVSAAIPHAEVVSYFVGRYLAMSEDRPLVKVIMIERIIS